MVFVILAWVHVIQTITCNLFAIIAIIKDLSDQNLETGFLFVSALGLANDLLNEYLLNK